MFFLVRHYPRSLGALAAHIDHPRLSALARRFLFDQTNKNPDSEVTSDDVDLNDCPTIEGKISVFHSTIAAFLPPVLNAVLVESVANISYPAHCSEGKRPAAIVPLCQLRTKMFGFFFLLDRWPFMLVRSRHFVSILSHLAK